MDRNQHDLFLELLMSGLWNRKEREEHRDMMEDFLREVEEGQKMGVNGARPEKVLIDDMDKKRRGPGTVAVIILGGLICYLSGFLHGQKKTEEVVLQYAGLVDKQQETIRSLRDDVLEEIGVLQRDLGIKLVFPGELDQRSKLVLMKELNQLVLSDMEEEE